MGADAIPPPSAGAPSLAARLAAGARSRRRRPRWPSVGARPAGRSRPPSSVLLSSIDRSRSVGLPGLSAERDLARRLLEALPPATRFDALFFDRGLEAAVPACAGPATREAIDALEAEMVPDRLQNGTDLAAALREAGRLLRREQTTFAPDTCCWRSSPTARCPPTPDAAALDRALGTLPGLERRGGGVRRARRPTTTPPPAPSRQACRRSRPLRGGVARELRTADIGDGGAGGARPTSNAAATFAAVRRRDRRPVATRLLAEALAPGAAIAGRGRSSPSQAPRPRTRGVGAMADAMVAPARRPSPPPRCDHRCRLAARAGAGARRRAPGRRACW